MDINTVDFPEELTALPKLTPRQNEILELITKAIDESGLPPTRAEIATQLGFASANAAEEHLRALAKKGYIELTPGTSRGIRIHNDSINPITAINIANCLCHLAHCNNSLCH